MEKDIVKDAKELAKKLHEGATDKYGNPYFYNLERFANRVRYMEYNMVDETSEINLYIAVAYLHDVIEDTEMELWEIESKFGKDIAVAIDLLTRKEGVTYSEYVERIRRDAKSDVIKSGKIARVVKLADLFDHLMGPTPCPPHLIKRYEKSLYTLIGSV